ncbi:MAG: queuosine precursor transporter [Microthrixaceae bacterium]
MNVADVGESGLPTDKVQGRFRGDEVTADPYVFTRRAARWLLISVSAYVACSLMANVMSVKILRVGPDWASFSVDAGTFTYPLTFTLRDMIHKVGGKAISRIVILAAGALNVVLALGMWVTSVLPGDPAVISGAQEHFGDVLAPVTRIVLASVVAQVLAELADTEVYQRFVDRFGHRIQWGRVVTSNAVSIPLDSILFVVIAFGGQIPLTVAVSIIWANIAVKGLTTLVSVPLIYLVPEEVQAGNGSTGSGAARNRAAGSGAIR